MSLSEFTVSLLNYLCLYALVIVNLGFHAPLKIGNIGLENNSKRRESISHHSDWQFRATIVNTYI